MVTNNGVRPVRKSRKPPLLEAGDIFGRVERKFRNMQNVFDRMDGDWDLYQLQPWLPDGTEAIGDEDIYTTNEPRVLAEKIVAFIAATVPVIIADNTNAEEPQEELNDLAESLAIGMLNNANRRLRRNGDPTVIDQLAHFTVVRGRYAAARAILRKRPNGDTFEDILPLDPRQLALWRGDGELKAAAYRMRWSVDEIEDAFPDFGFADRVPDTDETFDVYEYFTREPNENFIAPEDDPFGEADQFSRHPWTYIAGTLIDGKWARDPHDIFMLTFPVVIAPVTSQPQITPTENDQSPDVTFGESAFAENRMVWKQVNRSVSQVNNLMAKAVNPRVKVASLDGSKGMDDGHADPGAEIQLSTANQEAVENFVEADVNNAVAVLFQYLSKDSVGGGLPPQAFGILDKPLSSVALRQLGNNLEHRVLPRMRAVAACLEGCIENMMAQYETGSFRPITASGRRYDNHAFANRQIMPEEIAGHDPIEVRMDLALPEDEVSRWTVAGMAGAPTASGEPLVSLEWIREKILKVQSHKAMRRQNLEDAAESSDPVAKALSMFSAAIRDGNKALAAIWFDRLQVLDLQAQVQGRTMEQQLLLASQGLPIRPLGDLVTMDTGVQTTARDSASGQAQNPANGSPGVAERTGLGNQPSPQAGFNTTADRQRDTGLLGADGQPILAEG